MNMSDTNILKPKDFAELLGVSVKTLQRWDRSGVLIAKRTPTNRRYYTYTQYLEYETKNAKGESAMRKKDQAFIYGKNIENNSMITVNRRYLANTNGMILGIPGSGKIKAEINEIQQVLAKLSDRIFVIDTTGDIINQFKDNKYTYIINPISNEYSISAFNRHTAENEDVEFLEYKAGHTIDFFADILRTTNGGMISPLYMSILAKTIWDKYKDFFQTGETKDNDVEELSLYNIVCETIKSSEEAAGEEIANILSIHSDIAEHIEKGSKVDLTLLDKKKLFIYDVSSVPEPAKQVVMGFCLYDIIKYVYSLETSWVYINDMHILLKNGSFKLMDTLWKKARTNGCIITGITHDLSALMYNEACRVYINNSSFIIILNQTKSDASALKKMLSTWNSAYKHIWQYICNVGAEEGVIICDSAVKRIVCHIQ